MTPSERLRAIADTLSGQLDIGDTSDLGTLPAALRAIADEMAPAPRTTPSGLPAELVPQRASYATAVAGARDRLDTVAATGGAFMLVCMEPDREFTFDCVASKPARAMLTAAVVSVFALSLEQAGGDANLVAICKFLVESMNLRALPVDYHVVSANQR